METLMKYELIMLKLLFTATLALSIGLFASMLFMPYETVRSAALPHGSKAVPATMTQRHLACSLAADGVICLRTG